MVRPRLMSVVKLLIIHACKAWCKILDLGSYLAGKILSLASYLVVRWHSHCTSASNWELPLLCYPTLQGTSSLIKSWENTYNFSYCNQCHDLYHACRCKIIITFVPSYTRIISLIFVAVAIVTCKNRWLIGVTVILRFYSFQLLNQSNLYICRLSWCSVHPHSFLLNHVASFRFWR